jgi:hypothetical protein
MKKQGVPPLKNNQIKSNRGGRRPGAGRTKGVPNKLTTDVKGMILGALNEVPGQSYLAEQAKANPAAFMTLVGNVLPHSMQHSGPDRGPIEQVIMTPEQRAERALQILDEQFAEVESR